MRAQKIIVRTGKAMVRMAQDQSKGECKHHRSDDTLVFDCRACPHGKDLTDEVCIRRAIAALVSEIDVKELVLSGDWELLFGNGCVRVLNAYADLIRACRDSSYKENKSECCAECQNNPAKVISAIATRVPSSWDDVHRRLVSASPRPECLACNASLTKIVSRLEALTKEADRLAAKEAFHIVGVTQ